MSHGVRLEYPSTRFLANEDFTSVYMNGKFMKLMRQK